MRCSSTVPSQPVAASFTVSRGVDGWEVDAGIVHGLRDPVGDEAFVLACTAPDGAPAGAVRVTAVDVGRSSVEPIGWEPDDVAYAAVVADVPLPPAEVQLDPWVAPEPGDPRPGATAADVAAVHDAVVAAIASAGPDGTPSPYVRAVDPSTGSAGAVRLRVAVPEAGNRRDQAGRRQPGRQPARPASVSPRVRRASWSPVSSTSPGGSRSGRWATTRRPSPTP